jgi:predicted transcriptional regulator
MRVTKGTVVSGRVVFADSAMADGTDVYIVTRDPEETPRLSAEELAELEAGLAEADRGDMISGEELFLRLRRHG